MRADAPSHGLGIRKAPGPWWSVRKRAALSLWLTGMGSPPDGRATLTVARQRRLSRANVARAMSPVLANRAAPVFSPCGLASVSRYDAARASVRRLASRRGGLVRSRLARLILAIVARPAAAASAPLITTCSGKNRRQPTCSWERFDVTATEFIGTRG